MNDLAKFHDPSHEVYDKFSYSGIPRSSLFSSLIESLTKNDFESACHWVAEIDASNWHETLWEKLFIFASKMVHVHNPRLPQLFCKKMAIFAEVPHGVRRNHPDLRKNWCQIVAAIVFSPKGPKYDLPPSRNSIVDTKGCPIHPWIHGVTKKGDSGVAGLLLSRMFYARDFNEKLFVLNYIMEVEKSKDAVMSIQPRVSNRLVSSKYTTDWVWLFWDALLHGAASFSSRNGELYNTLHALYVLFSYNFTSARKKQKVPLLINGLLLFGDVDFSKEIFSNVELTMKACHNIHVMYEEIISRRQRMPLPPPKQQQQQSVVATVIGSLNQRRSPTQTQQQPLTSLDKIDMVDRLYYYGR
jgi:hypothetical protein